MPITLKIESPWLYTTFFMTEQLSFNIINNSNNLIIFFGAKYMTVNQGISESV